MGNKVKAITKPITNLFDITPPKPKVPNIVQQAAAAAPAPPAVQEVIDTGGEAASRAAPDVQEAAEEVRRRRTGRGRASTIITALEGQLPAGSVVRKALLGG